MRDSRLFQILYRLLSGGSVTAPQLARELEVSVRTIYRDVERLCAAGIPVQTLSGKGGGISLMGGFVMDRLLISGEEQQALLSALKAQAVLPGLEGEKLLGKLQALFPNQRGDWIEADFTRWGSPVPEKEAFATMKRAILQKRVLTFLYRDGLGRQSQRTVWPARLVFKQSAWYLQGFSVERSAYRTFKVSRISGLAESGEGFTMTLSPPPIDALPSESAADVAVQLRFSARLAHLVYDEFGDAAIAPLENGDLRVEAVFPAGDWLQRYLLSFGDGVTVESPAFLREAIGQEAKKVYERYRT